MRSFIRRSFERAPAISGVLLGALGALSAEVFFSPFLESGDQLVGISRVAIVFLSIFTIHRFASVSLRNYRENPKDVSYVSFMLVGSVVFIWLGNLLSLMTQNYGRNSVYLKNLTPECLYFAIPYAAGAMILQSVLGLHHCLVFTLSLALIAGIYVPGKALFVAMVVASCLVASLSVQRLRSRSTYMRAGLNVFLICEPFALASVILEPGFSSVEIIFRLAGPLVAGILCAFIAGGLTPVIEYLGGYVTDMRLLEMATLDHPLLKELSIQAPGTWNHSMVMGMMVEAAADATGANAVLARVGAYFHDIGKMKKPLYFVENQIPGENRHDKLSPSMSALIIRAHVKDGLELAGKHNLPRAIEDMIPQHHGTALIEYFYDKACSEAEENGDGTPVDESAYRYPGPKPQSPEAGILMLADGIEAACRTISDPTHDRIQGLVQKMINKVFSSGELDECDLTLKDLHEIAKAFTRVLTAIYHQRISYAEPAEKGAEDRSSDVAEGADAEVTSNEPSNVRRLKSGSEDRSSKEKETPRENLKRLGI